VANGVRNSVPRDLVPGFAATIKKAREEREWSQRDLADKANVSLMSVWGIEAEVRSPSLRVAAKIAEALKLKISLLDVAKCLREPLPAPQQRVVKSRKS